MSWKKQPTAEFLDAVSNVLCAYCMQNVHTFQGWEGLFKEAEVVQLETLPFSLGNTGMLNMVADEGLINVSKVMFKYMTNARIKKRMSTMNKFFSEHVDYFGYGIYIGRK